MRANRASSPHELAPRLARSTANVRATPPLFAVDPSAAIYGAAARLLASSGKAVSAGGPSAFPPALRAFDAGARPRLSLRIGQSCEGVFHERRPHSRDARPAFRQRSASGLAPALGADFLLDRLEPTGAHLGGPSSGDAEISQISAVDAWPAQISRSSASSTPRASRSKENRSSSPSSATTAPTLAAFRTCFFVPRGW